jgi:hypothetical protein
MLVAAMRRIRRVPVSLLGAVLLVAPAVSRADRLWTLQLEGGSVVLSLDKPEDRGRTIVFHRHPDALFASLPAKDVVRITSADGPPKKPKPNLDGKILVFGRDAEPPEHVARFLPPEPPDAYASLEPPAYAYAAPGYYVPRRHRGRPRASIGIGPNGFPILNPTFSGALPPPIGSNGFPILAPTPGPFDVGSAPPPPPFVRRPR